MPFHYHQSYEQKAKNYTKFFNTALSKNTSKNYLPHIQTEKPSATFTIHNDNKMRKTDDKENERDKKVEIK